MDLTNRVFFSDNGVLSDLSRDLGDYVTGSRSISVVAAEDAIFLGSDNPFNQRYMLVETAASGASVASVEYWNGKEFVAVVDKYDETAASGVTMAQSGHLTWVPNYDKPWNYDDTKRMTGLTTLDIRSLYWAKLKFSANTSFSLKYVGQKFATDEDVKIFYPDLVKAEVLEAYKTGKTSWEDQLIAASDFIIRDLKKRRIIFSSNQIMDRTIFREACIHKLADIIFTAFGNDYLEAKKQAKSDYAEAMQILYPKIDDNADAVLQPREARVQTEFASR